MYIYLLIEKIRIVLHIISQQIGRCSNEQQISLTVIERSTTQRADLLVDIQQIDVVTWLSHFDATTNQIQTFMRIVDKDLRKKYNKFTFRLYQNAEVAKNEPKWTKTNQKTILAYSGKF